MKGESPLSTNFVNDMETLLRLYEHVLVQERCRAEEPVTVLSVNEYGNDDIFSCDYCAADVFQSFFECRSCVPNTAEDPITVCAPCYSEGRSCPCTNMKPRQRRPFEDLQAMYDEGLAALDFRRRDSGLPQPGKKQNELRSEANFKSSDADMCFFRNSDTYAQLFQAGCYMNALRQKVACMLACLSYSNTYLFEKFAGSRKCAPITPREASHEVPGPWSLNCKKCHKAKCYTHMLQYMHMHSVEAMISYFQSESHDIYHNHHRISKSHYEEHLTQTQEAESRGEAPDLNVYLAYITSEYLFGRPWRAILQAGWYDSDDVVVSF